MMKNAMKPRIVFLMLAFLLAMTACEFVPNPKMSVNRDSLEVSAEGETMALSLSSVGKWRATYDFGHPYGRRYYSVYPYAGSGDAEITVTFEPNPTIEFREGKITFACESGDKTCTIQLPVFQE